MQKTLELKTKAGTLEFTTTKFEPFAAYMLLGKLGPVLLPAVLAASKGGMGGAFDAGFSTLTPELQQSLAMELLAQTQCVRPDAEGKLERIELTSITRINRACGSLKVMLLVMKHSLEVNYGDFFDDGDGLGSLIPTPSAST